MVALADTACVWKQLRVLCLQGIERRGLRERQSDPPRSALGPPKKFKIVIFPLLSRISAQVGGKRQRHHPPKHSAMDRSTAAAVATHARSLMLVTAVYIGLQPFAAAFHTTCGLRQRSSRGIVMETSETANASRGPEPSRPEWLVARDPCAVQGSPPVHGPNLNRQCSSMRKEGFDSAHITDVLVHEHRGDLVRLAQKYGQLIERAEDVETISVTDLDG